MWRHPTILLPARAASQFHRIGSASCLAWRSGTQDSIVAWSWMQTPRERLDILLMLVRLRMQIKTSVSHEVDAFTNPTIVKKPVKGAGRTGPLATHAAHAVQEPLLAGSPPALHVCRGSGPSHLALAQSEGSVALFGLGS